MLSSCTLCWLMKIKCRFFSCQLWKSCQFINRRVLTKLSSVARSSTLGICVCHISTAVLFWNSGLAFIDLHINFVSSGFKPCRLHTNIWRFKAHLGSLIREFPGIAILTTVNWRSLTNFLPKRGGGKSSVPNPFGQHCSLYTDVALFFFSFFLRTSACPPAKQARENFPHHYPLALAVNKSPAVYILSPALDGLWGENRGSVNRLTQTLTHCNRVKFRLTCILIYSSPKLVRYIRLLQIKMFFKIKEEAFIVLKSNFEMQIEAYEYI